MALSPMAYTLSQLLITAVFCYSSTLAQEICGPIGLSLSDSNETDDDLDAYKKDMFYLDMDNPAICTGAITSWRVCYYGPKNSNNKMYSVKYSVYRRNGANYIQVSNMTFITTLRGGGSDSQYDQLSEDGFYCHDESLDTPFAVQKDDIIGACVVNPKGPTHRLDIVSTVTVTDDNEQSSIQLYVPKSNDYERECRMSMDLPATIDFNQFSPADSMRLHLSANIMSLSKFTQPLNNSNLN